MIARSPHITLNNGVQMPAIGLGVFQTPPAETVGAVEAAIATGYRLVDTAAAYANEHEVGEGIRRSAIARDELFIETKIWISDYGYDSTLHAFDKSARKLGVDRIDLLLLHEEVNPQLGSHLNVGLNVGLTEAQLRSLIAVIDEKVGRKRAENAAEVLAQVMRKRHEAPPRHGTPTRSARG